MVYSSWVLSFVKTNGLHCSVENRRVQNVSLTCYCWRWLKACQHLATIITRPSLGHNLEVWT